MKPLYCCLPLKGGMNGAMQGDLMIPFQGVEQCLLSDKQVM